MKNLDQWFEAYSESHKNKTNILIHKFAVPLIAWSLLGALWVLPTPWEGFLAWSHFLAAGFMFFYFRLSMLYAGLMFLFLIACELSFYLLENRASLINFIVVFIIAWMAQFYGHKVEGKKPSFLEDIKFLAIGPLWVMKSIARK